MTDNNRPPPRQQDEAKTLSDFLRKNAPSQEVVSRPSATDAQTAELQNKLADLENKLHEERFSWVLAVIVIFDVAFLLDADNWSSPIVVGVLQLIGLIVFANRCRVDPIMPLIDRVAGMLPNRSPER